MKTLSTSGSGSLGRNLGKLLAREGHELPYLDRFEVLFLAAFGVRMFLRDTFEKILDERAFA